MTEFWNATSMSRIAQDAGVSKKTIYGRYRGKDALLPAVTRDVATRLVRNSLMPGP
jgi:AcrR family transcriptional regulator